MAKVIKWHKLGKGLYLVEMDICLAIVHTDDNGQIIRIATFGEQKGK